MSNEYRIWGPPGTGKTSFLAQQVGVDVKKYGPNKLVVCSLTRAAATEIAGRKLPIPREHIGTIHALALRAIGGGRVAETSKYLKQWNESQPFYRIGGTSNIEDAPDEIYYGESVGDRLFTHYKLNRVRMIPKPWQSNVETFATLWQNFKRETGTIDFCDMLEFALHDTNHAPGDPAVIYLDEAQDTALLPIMLVRHWAKKCERLYVAGDSDQCLYRWAGTDPEIMSSADIPENHKRVLQQSYRLPRAIHVQAVQFIQRIRNRELITFRSRDAEGEVLRPWGHFGYPESLVREYANNGNVMFLAACGYMLRPLIAILRREGISFHNPYRRTNGAWNPLRCKALLAYLQPNRNLWRVEDVQAWAEPLQAEGTFLRGAKTSIKDHPNPKAEVTPQMLLSWMPKEMAQDAFSAMLRKDASWWESRLRDPKKYAYALTVLRKHGPPALTETPKVVVGSIHSVKGGESDTVVLAPDLSIAGMQEYMTSQGRDDIIRQFYVGMTRARERLVLCQPMGQRAVRW